ncbi:MAG: hypothetical protein ABIP89_09670 [Polyangiaceae bacterium]
MIAKLRSMSHFARSFAVRMVHALAVIVLLSGIARAGTRYFYCPLMDVVLSASCCDHTGDKTSQREFRPSDCCESRSNEALPPAADSTPPQAIDAPLVAILAPIAWVLSRTSPIVPPERFRYAASAGPPSPSAARAELMVFVI